MSSDEKIPWWELPGAPGENRTREEYEAHIRALKEPNPSIQTTLHKQRFKADKVMTPEEYAAMPIIGWHYVCKDYDGFGAIGIKYRS